MKAVLKGEKFYGPDGVQGYEAATDLYPMTAVMADSLIAFGGAPKPEAGEICPEWLMKAVSAKMHEDDDK